MRVEKVRPEQRRGEQGSSLFEVTLALGLLAAVLGSIAGLFVLGAGSVNSGRNASEALSVARSMIEEMQGWELREIYQTYGCDGSLGSCVVDSTTDSELAAWQALLDEKIPGAYVTVALATLEPTATVLRDSFQVRVMVTVYWNEGSRSRKIRLGTVRIS